MFLNIPETLKFLQSQALIPIDKQGALFLWKDPLRNSTSPNGSFKQAYMVAYKGVRVEATLSVSVLEYSSGEGEERKIQFWS